MKSKKYYHLLISDYGILIILLLISALLRVILIDKIPYGLHGDEGWTGLDALSILSRGWIGPYTGNALGQPTGPLYLTAFFLKLFGSTITSIRLSMALFGILTIPVFYLVLRLFFSKKISFITGLTLCFSVVHLHYSRIAFMLISAPFIETVVLIFFFLSIRRKSGVLAALCGVATGIGMYSYNAYLPFPLLLLIIQVALFTICYREKWMLKNLLFFTGFFFLSSFFLIRVMVLSPNFYFSHHTHSTIFSLYNYQHATNIYEKIILILKNGFSNILTFFWGHKGDGSDGMGSTYTFNLFELVVFLVGLITIFIRHRKSDMIFLFSFIFIFIFSFITFEAIYRRLILNVVYFYFIYAIGLSVLIEKMFTKKEKIQRLILFALFLFFIVNLKTYFFDMKNSDLFKFTFSYELKRGFEEINSTYKKGDIVYLYSSRWGCHYESILYFVPHINCYDRSKEFGKYSIKTDNKKTSYFLLLNQYQLTTYRDLKNMYPRGETIALKDSKNLFGYVFIVRNITKTF